MFTEFSQQRARGSSLDVYIIL